MPDAPRAAGSGVGPLSHAVARTPRTATSTIIRPVISIAPPPMGDYRASRPESLRRGGARSAALGRSRSTKLSSSDQKASVLHELPPVHGDRRVRGQHVDVRRAFPIGTRLEAIRIAERDVAPWKDRKSTRLN